MVRLIYILGFSLYTSVSWAQIDPSSALLLRNSSPTIKKEQYEGGRYTIRSGENNPEPKVPASTVTPLPAKVVAKPVVNPTPPVQEPSAPAKVEEQGVGTKLERAIIGAPPEEIEEYRDQLHPQDTRQNLMELEIAPGFLYVDAQSNYWPRRYTFAAPDIKVAAKIWVSPFFGLEADFRNSLDGSVSKLATSQDRIKAEQQWFSVGLRWRNYFGLTRRAESITFGLDYQEYQMAIPSDVTSRNKTKTVGLKILLEMTLPKSNSFAWQYGGWLVPRADHLEFGTTATFTSGGQDSTTVAGIWFGGLNTFNRHNQVFWKIEQSFEKTQFEGAATAADPQTGTAPEGVSVTTGFTSISLGYRWGY